MSDLGNTTKYRRLMVSALVAATAFGAAPDAALAQHGDVARGLLLGLVAGYAVNQYVVHHNALAAAPATGYGSYASQGYAGQVVSAEPSAPAPVRTVERAPLPAPVGQTPPDARAFTSQERQVRISIQYNLMRAGFYNSTLDGFWGPNTQAAVFDYARAHDKVAMLTSESQSRRLYADILQQGSQ